MICRSLSAAVAAAALILPVSINSAPVNAQVQVHEAPVVAQGYGRRDRGRDRDRWLQELNLTLEQSERIQAIKEQSRENMSSLKEQMRAAREEMRSLMAGTGTPQQRNKMAELIEQRDRRKR